MPAKYLTCLTLKLANLQHRTGDLWLWPREPYLYRSPAVFTACMAIAECKSRYIVTDPPVTVTSPHRVFPHIRVTRSSFNTTLQHHHLY